MHVRSARLRRPFQRLACVASLAASVAAPLGAHAATSAWIASSTEKIQPSAIPGAGTAATLSAARNEFEAVQVGIEGPATGVSVTATPLSGPGQIPPPRLFREELINLTNVSGPDGATGPFPDALIPDVDDVVGEKRNAFPFDVPSGEARAVWVEVHVPADAAPGTYQGTITVHASGAADVDLPLTLTVWNFALPSTSSLKSHFGLYWSDLAQAHGVSGDALYTLRARYAQLGLDHRISIGGFDDGYRAADGSVDLAHYTQYYGALIDGTASTQLMGAKVTSVQYTGARSTSAYASWASWFRSKGWFDRLFDYTCDEPPATCAWSDISVRNAMIKAADPALRTLVTTSIGDATSNGVDGSIDVIVPVVNYMYDKPGNPYPGAQRPTYAGFLAAGPQKELWMYQSCMSHGCGGTSDYFSGWVTYAIDSSAIRSRGMEWLSFQYGVTGELYWETTWEFENGDAWSTQWQFGGNGDGTLFYPGTPARIGGQTDIPVASLRLKMIREGMEDFEYLKLLSDAGDPALATQIASQLFPDPWTQPSTSDLLAAREQIARRIVQLTAAGSSAGGPAGPAAGSASTGAGPSGPIVLDPSSVNLKRLGAGCSAGGTGELAAGTGVVAALLFRRRRRSRR